MTPLDEFKLTAVMFGVFLTIFFTIPEWVYDDAAYKESCWSNGKKILRTGDTIICVHMDSKFELPTVEPNDAD